MSHLLIVGATGMVGGAALRHAVRDRRVERITTIGRRRTGGRDDKLVEVVHDDFLDYRAARDALVDVDAAICAIGGYAGALTDEELRAVTLDYPVAFADALLEVSPDAALCFVSHHRADPTKTSRSAVARYKGAAESALLARGSRAYTCSDRPYVYPVRARTEPTFGYEVLHALYPALSAVYPNVGVESEDLARVMIQAALLGTGEHRDPVIDNRAIRQLIARLP